MAPSSPCWFWPIRIIHILIRVRIFLVVGTRLASKGAELGGCIQDPSHIFIGLGPCLGRGWRVGGPGAMLGAWGREVQPKIWSES